MPSAVFQLRVLSLLLHQTVDLDSDHGIYKALQMLTIIISQNIIRRDVALSIFKTAWPLFAAKHYEQLLIPFSRALAWSLVKSEEQLDAIQILQDILKAEQPFCWTTTKHTLNDRPLTLLPLDMLLRQLRCDELWPMEMASTLNTVPIAIITETKVLWGMPATSMCRFHQDALLRTGILFADDGIHIIFSSTQNGFLSRLEIILSVTQVPCQLPTNERFSLDGLTI